MDARPGVGEEEHPGGTEMTGAKELLAEIDGLSTTMFDDPGTQIDAQAELLLRARAWIERWAPVVSLTTELRRLDNLEAPFAEQLGMANRLESAIDVALGEDKP